MTVDVSSVVLETAQLPASVDVADVIFSTATVTSGSAHVDVSDVILQTNPPSASARVDVASVYLSMNGDTSNVQRWVAWQGNLLPVIELGVAWHGRLVI